MCELMKCLCLGAASQKGDGFFFLLISKMFAGQCKVSDYLFSLNIQYFVRIFTWSRWSLIHIHLTFNTQHKHKEVAWENYTLHARDIIGASFTLQRSDYGEILTLLVSATSFPWQVKSLRQTHTVGQKQLTRSKGQSPEEKGFSYARLFRKLSYLTILLIQSYGNPQQMELEVSNISFNSSAALIGLWFDTNQVKQRQ